MERKKVVTAVLLVAVAAIWGVIIFRVLRGIRQDTTAISRLPVTNPVVVMKSKDSLLLNYKDPFLDRFAKDKSTAVATKKVAKNQSKSEKTVHAPDIQFKGLIGNGENKNAMVLENGRLHMLDAGDTIDGFIVLDFTPQCLRVQKAMQVFELKVK